jgi:hypothetical protein
VSAVQAPSRNGPDRRRIRGTTNPEARSTGTLHVTAGSKRRQMAQDTAVDDQLLSSDKRRSIRSQVSNRLGNIIWNPRPTDRLVSHSPLNVVFSHTLRRDGAGTDHIASDSHASVLGGDRAAKRDNAGLGNRIGNQRQVTGMSVHRRNVHDCATAIIDHALQRRAAAKHRSPKGYTNHFVPGRYGDLGSGSLLKCQCYRGGTVYEHAQRSAELVNGSKSVADIGFISDIGRQRHGVAAVCDYAGNHLLRAGLVSIDDDDVGALSCKQIGNAGADQPRTTRDDSRCSREAATWPCQRAHVIHARD